MNNNNKVKTIEIESAKLYLHFGHNGRLEMYLSNITVADTETDKSLNGKSHKVLPQDQIKILMNAEKGIVKGTFGIKVVYGREGIYLI